MFDWNPEEQERVVKILRLDLEHPNTFVRAWALDSLAMFALRDKKLRPIVERSVKNFEASASKALSARARQIRARLRESG